MPSKPKRPTSLLGFSWVTTWNLKKQRAIEKLLLWCARRLPYEVRTRREWIVIRDWRKDVYSGEIPKDVLADLASALSLDPDDRFIRDDLSYLLRQQPEWIDLLPLKTARIS